MVYLTSLIAFFIVLFFAWYFYLQAEISGLGKKRWAILGLFFGPFVLPLFIMRKHIEITKRYGRNFALWKA